MRGEKLDVVMLKKMKVEKNLDFKSSQSSRGTCTCCETLLANPL